MKNFPLLRAGQTVLVAIKNKEEKEEYFSKIENIENKYIYLNNPFEEKNVKIKNGDTLQIFILENNEVYDFAGSLLEINFGNPPELKVEILGEINQNQRRISMRFPVSLSVKYEIFQPKSFFRSSYAIQGIALARNISIGGMLLETENKIHNNSSNITLHFTLPAYPTMDIKGEIKRLASLPNHRSEFVVNFIDLDPNDRENIIRYIFDSQKKHILEKTVLEKL
ncbi:PilZ domain-containing protein [Candidatus Desantisbacteria bacterium]|nr:PilZ domain-containing protein [Candidatus Desantisbacteria bacterium]